MTKKLHEFLRNPTFPLPAPVPTLPKQKRKKIAKILRETPNEIEELGERDEAESLEDVIPPSVRQLPEREYSVKGNRGQRSTIDDPDDWVGIFDD